MDSIARVSLFVMLFVAVWPAAADEPARPSAPQFLRLAVVDVSGSMSGERLDVARGELLRLVEQLVPSPAHPLVVVPFESNARPVETLTDLVRAQQYLANLSGGGGTNIASGLAKAISELQRYPNTANVCVFLYTDGEDGMHDQIAAQEAKLDALFADRRTRGLDQTVVFCKRWQGAGAQLVKRLEQSGNARIIDAAELDLVPITLTPHVTVQQARWVKGRPATLEVELAAHVEMHGQDTTYTGGPLHLECRTPNTEGDVQVVLDPPNATPTPVAIRLDLPPEAALAGGQVELQFELSQPVPTHDADRLTLPILTLDQLTVPVDLPVADFRTIIAAQIEQTDPGRWADPVRLEPVFPMRLALQVTAADDDATWTCPVPFRLSPQSGTRLVDGQDTITLHGPGQYELAFSITAKPTNHIAPTGLPEFAVAFRLHPETRPPNVHFDPPEVRFDTELAAPAALLTDISARIVAVGRPRWVDLRQGVAVVDANLAVQVDGPIWPDAELVLQCPPPVRDLAVTPSVLHQGTQTVRLRFLALLPPAPATKELAFQILPPAQQGAVRLRAIHPFTHAFGGPPPVQLALSDGRHVRARFQTSHRDSTRPATLSVVPVVLGLDDQAAAAGLAGTVRASGLATEHTGNLPLYLASQLQITFPADAPRSFFRDTRRRGQISIAPQPDTPALIGSTHTIQATLEAPFKRLLFQLALAICGLLAFVLLLRMYLRLRMPPEI